MASNNNKEAKIKISTDLSTLNRAMREAARSIQIANAEFKKATAGMDDWSDSADGLKSKLKQLYSTFRSQERQLDVLNDKLILTCKNQGENSEAAERLRVQIAKQEAKLQETREAVSKYTVELKGMEKESDQAEGENKQLAKSFDSVADNTEKAGTKLEKFAEVLGKGVTGAAKIAGKAILAIGTASAAAGAAAVKSGADFDAQMSTVKAISQATEEEYEALREKAIEMGSSTVFTATESAKALEYMGMAGWKAEDMLDGLEGIINAAAASGEDLGKVSDIITDGLTAFGLQAKDSSHFADVLAQASANANTNIELMGESFKYVAPIAGAFKYSVDDVAVGIGLMANSGIKAEMAGTSLRAMLTRLASPTKDVVTAMEELGLSLTDDEGNMKSFDTLLQDMQKSFKGLTETEKAHYASKIAGRPAMSGMLALVNATSTDYNTLADSIRNADGAAKEMADTRLDNLAGDVTLFKSALDAAKISLSDELSPALREIVQEGTAMLPELSGDVAELGGALADVVKGLMPIAKDTISAIVPLAREIMDAVKDILPYLSQMIQSLLPPAQKIIEAIIKVAKPFIENVLPPLTNLIDQVAKVLSGLLDVLTPILEVISEIYSTIYGGFATAWSTVLSIFTDTTSEAEKLRDEFSALSEQELALTENAKQFTDEQKALKESLKSGFEEIDKGQGVYDRMKEKLEAITDSSGKIKYGYEDLAKYIVNRFNSDYGTQIEIVDGVIQKYDEEIKKLEELRTAKRAAAYLESAEDEYNTALDNRKKYGTELVKNQTALANAEKEKQDLLSQRLMAENLAAVNGESFDAELWEAKLDGVNDKIRELNNTVTETKANIANNEAIISNFDNLETAIAENDIPKIKQAMEEMKMNFIDASTGTEETLKKQTVKLKREFTEMQKAAKEKGSGITQEMVANAEEMYIRSAQEWQKLSGMTDEELLNTLKAITGKDQAFGDAGTSLAAMTIASMRNELEARRGEIISAVQSIADGVSQIPINVSVNSPSDIVYYSQKYKKTATGGIVTRAQTRIVGEDGAEAIVPLEKNTGWIDAVAQKVVNAMGAGSSGGNFGNTTYNFYQTNNSPKALSRLEIYRQSKNLLAFKR